MKTVCLIPLRRGSKGIPGKNIMPLAGKPMAGWAVEAALNAQKVEEVWVSTDSSEIRETLSELYPELNFADRDPKTATDTASTESVMIDFMNQADFELLLTVQATSPLTQSSDIDAAIEQLLGESADSLVTGVLQKRFYWSIDGVPLNYDPMSRPRRQDFSGSIIENGAFYLTRKEVLRETGCRLGGKVSSFVMDESHFHELDELSDVPLLEKALLQRSTEVSNIEVLICDVDGTLTDGGMFYGVEGDLYRKFNTRDAKGLALLRELGVRVVILSTENSPITKVRAEKLELDDCFVGVKDKAHFLKNWAESNEILLREIAYIGDDINDLEAMSLVGYVGCPADAAPQILEYANYICASKGGQGAVREFAETILSKNKNV